MRMLFGLGVFVCSASCLAPIAASAGAPADGPPVQAQLAVIRGCSTEHLNETGFAKYHRLDPEWAPIRDANDPHNPADPLNGPFDRLTILEGTVVSHTNAARHDETAGDQAPSEVAETDTPYNHFTHDKTQNIVPDLGYRHLLSAVSTGAIVRPDMELEWEEGSAMSIGRGPFPQFAWPSVYDRVWVEGQWIFDCGHMSSPISDLATVHVDTEIHPPRALVTFRLNRGAILPVNGKPAYVAVTQADAFVSGFGGGALDHCNLVTRHLSLVPYNVDSCTHTGPYQPLNDRNYVFDIYPPGTDYTSYTAGGSFVTHAPTNAASAEYSAIDRGSAIPRRACGPQPCVQVRPIVCLIDASVPPPTQRETGCPIRRPCKIARISTLQPPCGSRPSRVRVILPFKGSKANVFAKTLFVGWNVTPSVKQPVMTFKVTLRKFSVHHNGESFLHNGDWRVFVDVGGEWRYLSDPRLFDKDGNGNNACHGDPLTNNGDDDCYAFNKTPWIVRVWSGQPIHIAVGGYESDVVDSVYCNDYGHSACDPSAAIAAIYKTSDDDRIGTLEFDLDPHAMYAAATNVTQGMTKNGPIAFDTPLAGGENTNYGVEFFVQRVPN